jgi:hypothetical protein
MWQELQFQEGAPLIPGRIYQVLDFSEDNIFRKWPVIRLRAWSRPKVFQGGSRFTGVRDAMPPRKLHSTLPRSM